MFANGPASATIASPHLWFRRLYGLKGTGFAQPIIKPPNRYDMTGKIKEPNHSKCLKGLSVSLPANFAALSPCKYAA